MFVNVVALRWFTGVECGIYKTHHEGEVFKVGDTLAKSYIKAGYCAPYFEERKTKPLNANIQTKSRRSEKQIKRRAKH